jgi:hypothetical protein
MRESQFDELCGLRQIAVSCAMCKYIADAYSLVVIQVRIGMKLLTLAPYSSLLHTPEVFVNNNITICPGRSQKFSETNRESRQETQFQRPLRLTVFLQAFGISSMSLLTTCLANRSLLYSFPILTPNDM